MGKVIFCKDLEMDCEWVARADTEEELLKKVSEHVAEAHHMKDMPEAITEKVSQVMCEE